jgi:predicted PurR-regulated permease PerM
MPASPKSRTSTKGGETTFPNPQTRKWIRAGLGFGILLLALWVAQEFLAPLCWAVVIALTTWPAYKVFAARIADGRSVVLAPLVFTLLVGAILFVPILVAIHQAAQESQLLMQSLAHARDNGIPVPKWLVEIPLGEHAARWWAANLSEPQSAREWLGSNSDKQAEAEWTRAMGVQLLHRLFMFFIALIALFVMLRSGAWIGNRALDTADRLLGDPGERLASRMVETVRGTVTGTLIVAVAEGAIIGMAYILAGVPSPLLFALLTAAFAIIPFGAWMIFSSAALLLLHDGNAMAAAAVFGFGALVMIIGDTFVWPALVGKQARLPFLAALVGIFGGLQAFGLIGLIVGPMILAALWTVWREWLLRPDPSRA